MPKSPEEMSPEELYGQHKEDAARPEGEGERRDIAAVLAEAREVLGAENVYGSEAAEKTWGVEPALEELPAISVSRAELERARELGQVLELRIAAAPDGSPLTMAKMQELRPNDEPTVYSELKGEQFYESQTPQTEWVLRTREVLPGSTGKNYLEQTQMLADYVRQVFAAEFASDHPEWKEAIDEFEANKAELAVLVEKDDWEEASRRLAELKLNQMARRTPVDVAFDIQVARKMTGTYELANGRDWTNTRSSDGALVRVGDASAMGADVKDDYPQNRRANLGVSFSRSLSPRPERARG